jgi:Fe-S cluster assembly scaffold protein SufB
MTDASISAVILTDAESTWGLQTDARSRGHAVVRIADTVKNCTLDISINDEALWDVTVMTAAEGAALKIQQNHHIATGARLGLHIITLHPQVTHDVRSHVTGNDGESSIDWMFYGKGSERQTLNVRNIFDGRQGSGEILMRGITEDHAHTDCKGMIEIGLQGGGTNTYLTQEVLMLDATSKVDAIPALEIKTNDVKASHSATIARVTEEDLFYFGARGIDPHEARRMFVLGFLGDITERIPDDALRQEIIDMIEKKYGVAA